MKPIREFVLLKELSRDIKDIKRRLIRMERVVVLEQLTREDLRAIKKSEEEIKKGKYVTAEQLKKELGIG